MTRVHLIRLTAPSLAGLVLASCGNPMVMSAGKNCPARSTSKLQLAETGTTPAAQTLGGFLVADTIVLADILKKPLSESARIKDRTCSSAFRFRERDGRFFVQITTSISCYAPFYGLGEKRHILVSPLESGGSYSKFEVTDPRFDGFRSLFAEVDALKPTEAYRLSLIQNAVTLGTNGRINRWLSDDLKLDAAGQTEFKKRLCSEGSKSTPVPESCAWLRNAWQDEVEVKLSQKDDAAKLLSLVQTSNASWSAKIAALRLTNMKLASDFEKFNEAFTKFGKNNHKISANTATNFLLCDDKPKSNCDGKRDTYALLIAKHLAPEIQPLIRPFLLKADPQAASDEYADFVRNWNDTTINIPYTRPMFNAYVAILEKVGKNSDLLGIGANHLKSAAFEPGQHEFKVFASNDTAANGAMSGISIVPNDLQLLVNVTNKEKNKNLTFKEQDGSIVTLAGLPLVGFAPASIDQSGGASLVALPSRKASGASNEASKKAPVEPSTRGASEGGSASEESSKNSDGKSDKKEIKDPSC